jgi:hypothetical protein
MLRLPPQFRLRTQLIAVAVAAATLEAYILLRPSKPQYVSAPPQRNVLRVARLMYDGEWNADPLAFTHLGPKSNVLGFTLTVNEAALLPGDPNLIYYPLLYLHGRGTVSFSEQELTELRVQLSPGGGILFADTACGDTAFDAAFRPLVARLFPGNRLVPIPRDDELFSTKIGFDLSKSQYTKAAGGGKDIPELEGVKIDGHWAIIYSKYSIACALQSAHDGGCKGYMQKDASKIGANVLIYSTLPDLTLHQAKLVAVDLGEWLHLCLTTGQVEI